MIRKRKRAALRPPSRLRLSAMMIALGALALGILVPAGVQAATLTVESGGTYTTIQSAINAAANGDTVLVTAGTYYENLEIDGKDITLTAESTDDPESYVIDGQDLDPVINYLGTITDGLVQGFKITSGYSDSLDPKCGLGGGICGIGTGTPIDVMYNLFYDNEAGESGAGLSHVTGNVMYNTFDSNTAGFSGGAACNVARDVNPTELVGTFAYNEVKLNKGGDFSEPGSGSGGGVLGFKYVIGNRFHENEGYWSGAIDLAEVVRNNVVYKNKSARGAIANSLIIENNTIYGNTTNGSSDEYPGIYITHDYFDEDDVFYEMEPLIQNNIVWGNTCGTTTDDLQVYLKADGYGHPDTTVKNCCIQDNTSWDGYTQDDTVSDITATDPDLADPDDGTSPDFRLTEESTDCIDEGLDNSSADDDTGVDEDFDGNPRPLGDEYDMGAYEYDGWDVSGTYDIKSADGDVVARFLYTGDVLLKGTFTSSATITPDASDQEFIIKDYTGGCIALIDSSGNMEIDGTLTEEAASLTTSSDPEFVVQDPSGAAFCIIDETGNMDITGQIYAGRL